MSWLEQKIRRYEHARWTTDDNRRVYPFEWGLEHIGGGRGETDPRPDPHGWGDEKLGPRGGWFCPTPPGGYFLLPAGKGGAGGRGFFFSRQNVSPRPGKEF